MKVEPLNPLTQTGALALVICLWSSGCATNRHSANPLEAKVDQLFKTWDRPGSPGAAVVVIKDGAVDYQHGYPRLIRIVNEVGWGANKGTDIHESVCRGASTGETARQRE